MSWKTTIFLLIFVIHGAVFSMEECTAAYPKTLFEIRNNIRNTSSTLSFVAIDLLMAVLPRLSLPDEGIDKKVLETQMFEGIKNYEHCTDDTKTRYISLFLSGLIRVGLVESITEHKTIIIKTTKSYSELLSLILKHPKPTTQRMKNITSKFSDDKEEAMEEDLTPEEVIQQILDLKDFAPSEREILSALYGAFIAMRPPFQRSEYNFLKALKKSISAMVPDAVAAEQYCTKFCQNMRDLHYITDPVIVT